MIEDAPSGRKVAFRKSFWVVVAGLALGLSVLSSKAQLTAIAPFFPDKIETFESFPLGFTNSPLSIMSGAASVQTIANGILIGRPLSRNFSLTSSSANAPGACATPADGQNFLGIEDSQNPTASIDVVFTNTVASFGGYWGAATANSNSPATISFSFFDGSDVQIGSSQSVSYNRPSGDGLLEWHGWFSSVPFKRVRITAVTTFELVGDSFRAGNSGFSLITAILSQPANQYVLQGVGTPSTGYTMQANTNISTTNWVALGTAQTDVNGTWKFTNSSSLQARFYRLKAP